MKRFVVVAVVLAIAAFAGCDQALEIQDHPLAADAGCAPCVLDTTALDSCCLQ